jgi:hypothetical protein
MSQDNSFGIVTGYGLGFCGLNLAKGKIFLHTAQARCDFLQGSSWDVKLTAHLHLVSS